MDICARRAAARAAGARVASCQSAPAVGDAAGVLAVGESEGEGDVWVVPQPATSVAARSSASGDLARAIGLLFVRTAVTSSYCEHHIERGGAVGGP